MCVCVCAYARTKSACVGVVRTVSMTGVVLADSLVLNSSPLLPTTNTHIHTHKTSVLHTTVRLCYHDAAHFLLINNWYGMFTATFWNMETSCRGRSAVKTYLWRAAYFTRVSSFQYPLITTTPNVTWARKRSALSKHNVTAPQIYPIPMSWLHIVQSPGGFETFSVAGLFPPTSTTHNKQSGDL